MILNSTSLAHLAVGPFLPGGQSPLGNLFFKTDNNRLYLYTGSFWDGVVTDGDLQAPVITLNGDITGSGTSPITATLATVNSAPVSDVLQKITVNDKGLVTASSNVTAAELISILTFTPANKAGDTFTGPVILNGNPTVALEAVPKQYADGLVPQVAEDTSATDVYPLFAIATSGNVGPKISSSNYLFNPSTGTLSATVFNTLSDERFKQNIRPMPYGLREINSIAGKMYELSESDLTSLGVIAQEVRYIIPEAVTEDSAGKLGVNYQALTAVLLEAVKELSVKLTVLETKLKNANIV